jgi:hypothetical protein
VKVFRCPACGADVWFDDLTCIACATELVYDEATDLMVAGSDGILCPARATVEACNWRSEAGSRCPACALDCRHEPTAARAPFQRAKRRTLRQLTQLGIDHHRLAPRLRFDMRRGTDGEPVTIGHADGVITLDTAESDPGHRESVRTALDEPYRTPLGHVRHELGHWWWAAAAGERFELDDFRRAFGDERVDYAAALERHYDAPEGGDGDWRERHVSHYAASHPWEDFAESFAHLLHLLDTAETAASHGLGRPPALDRFDETYADWVSLTVTLNELNRSMGMPDAYPFAVSPTAVDKIRFVARTVT